MSPYDAGYGFVQMLVGLLDSLWPIAGPFVIMAAIIGVFAWVNSLSRGQVDDE